MSQSRALCVCNCGWGSVGLAPYHIDLVVIHEDTHTQQEGEKQFVLLKERPTHIAV